MKSETKRNESEQNETKHFFIGLARAFGGAILFSFPIIMTMEMWQLGFYMNGFRLALFTLLTIPLLIGLSYYDGFEVTSSILDDTIDTFAAYAVGFVASAFLLFLFGIIKPSMSPDEIIGKVSIQAIVAGFGAMLTQSLLTDNSPEQEVEAERKRSASYIGELFLMAVGAIFLSLSVAPTEEMLLISYQITDWQTVGLCVFTLMLMHAFVYAVKYAGYEKAIFPNHTFLSSFFRFTIVGYAIALLISFYVLWTFGNIDNMAFAEQLKVTIVLGFPAAIGASASRLIL